MTRYELIKDTIENMNMSDIVALHNAYCEEDNCMDDFVFSMDEFDEVMDNLTPSEIARCVYHGNFKPGNDYFRFDGYYNLYSFNFWDEETSGIYTSDIAEYVDNNNDDLCNVEIAEILAGD